MNESNYEGAKRAKFVPKHHREAEEGIHQFKEVWSNEKR